MSKQKKDYFGAAISVLIIICLCSIIGYIFVATTSVYERLTDNIKINIGNIKDKYNYGDVKEFAILAGRFADQHEYSDEYNCVNYTRDLYNIANSLGFDVKQYRGCKESNKSECHRWLKLVVDFEPQDGEFVDYSKKYLEQKEVEDVQTR